MHSIRRSAFRAAISSASFISKPHSVTIPSPFIVRAKPLVNTFSTSRRFLSNDVDSEGHHLETESKPSSLNSEDQPSIAETASNYASDAAGNLSETASAAKDAIVGTVSNLSAAVGIPSARRVNSGAYQPNSYVRENGRSSLATTSEGSGQPLGRNGPLLQPNNGIYVGNFTFDTTAEDLKREFGQFGEIDEVIIAKDSRDLSKGFGYVRFTTVDAATAAIHAKDQTIMDGRRIAVNYQLRNSRSVGTNPPGKTLFIGNLAFEMSDADLNKLFRDIKNVLDVRVAIDRRTGQPRGFAHADFMDIESATEGMKALKGKAFYGRVLRVDYAGPDKKYDAPPSM